MKNRLTLRNIPSIITFLVILYIISNQHFKYIKLAEEVDSYINIKNELIKTIKFLEEDNNKLKLKYNNFIQENFVLSVTVTAYTNSIDETNSDNQNTAIMENPKPGWTIAVSQDLLYLLGKKVYIEGIGVRYVNDLMNKRYKNRVDILVPIKKYARNFGVKKNKKLVLID